MAYHQKQSPSLPDSSFLFIFFIYLLSYSPTLMSFCMEAISIVWKFYHAMHHMGLQWVIFVEHKLTMWLKKSILLFFLPFWTTSLVWAWIHASTSLCHFHVCFCGSQLFVWNAAHIHTPTLTQALSQHFLSHTQSNPLLYLLLSSIMPYI